MATLQVRGIDDALYRALGARAELENRSISQEVTKMIREFLARPGAVAEEATEAFLRLSGSWRDVRTARDISRDLRKARRTNRRFVGGRDVFA